MTNETLIQVTLRADVCAWLKDHLQKSPLPFVNTSPILGAIDQGVAKVLTAEKLAMADANGATSDDQPSKGGNGQATKKGPQKAAKQAG